MFYMSWVWPIEVGARVQVGMGVGSHFWLPWMTGCGKSCKK